MANVIYSGNSYTNDRERSGPGVGLSANVSSASVGRNVPAAGPAGAVPVGAFPAMQQFGQIFGNNLVGNGNVDFNNITDTLGAISSILQNTFGGGSQAANNRAYRELMQMQNDYNTNSANKAMKFSREMAERQMQFQQYNADTTYQRAVADLKKAGLNPILAALNGAPSPAGSSAQGVAAMSAGSGYDEGYNGISSVVNSLISNLPMLTIASAVNGLYGKSKNSVKDVIDNGSSFVNHLIDEVGKMFDLSAGLKDYLGKGFRASKTGNSIGAYGGGTR